MLQFALNQIKQILTQFFFSKLTEGKVTYIPLVKILLI